MKNLYLSALLFFVSFQLSGQQVSLQFNYDNPQAVSNLIGFNTGFNHRHWVERVFTTEGTVYTDVIRDDLLNLLEGIKQPILRFPGGVIANFYHLYPAGYQCESSLPCEDDFVKGYGLRENEVVTFNNGAGAVSAEYNFEELTGDKILSNWIVSFANLVDAYQNLSSDTLEVVYMANVLSHFEFNNQAAQFDGDLPQQESMAFQRSIQETRDALRYLIEVRGLKVTKVELGTELYFQSWANNNEVNVDRFINLLPVYRDMLDSQGFEAIKIGVPFDHRQSLAAGADNWSRKLADASYHSNQVFDAWILHDYQRMVEPCQVVFGNCSNCTNWEDEECSLYNGNPTIFNCEPDNHSPSSQELEEVYRRKNDRFAEAFNGGLAGEYQATLNDLRALSGLDNSKLWMTEWNQVFDAGCDQWKGINKFFPNTFAHGVNIFEILQSLYAQNAMEDNQFMDLANFHTLAAPNVLYPVINAVNGDDAKTNATYYPFYFTSLIHEEELRKIELISNTVSSPSEANFHAYYRSISDSSFQTFLYFSNKTEAPISIDLVGLPNETEIEEVKISYLTAEALHSSMDGDYLFNPVNVEVEAINTEFATTPSILTAPYTIPALSFGYIQFDQKDLSNNTAEISENSLAKIFPNPAQDILSIELDQARQIELSIFNSLGELIRQNVLSDQRSNVDISHLPSGVYFFRLENDGKVQSGKLVKN